MTERLTLMVMTGVSSKVRRYSIPKWIFPWLAGASVVFALILTVLSFNYYIMFKKLSTTDLLNPQKKVIVTKIDDSRLGNFTYAISTIRRDMQNLEKTASKFRVMMGLQKDVDRHKLSGMGGNSTDPFKKVNVFRGNQLFDEMLKDIEKMEIGISKQKTDINELADIMEERHDLLNSTPSLWPTKGWVTSRFGMRISPFTGRREFHRGLDVSAPKGTLVESPADGIVTFAGRKGSLGKAVEVNHGFGIITCYGHNSKLLVREGQRVVRGEPLSLVGSTGRSTGPHLHYEIRIAGVAVNPWNYILN